MVVVYLCGGSGKPSRDVAFLFSPKSQNVSKSTKGRSGGVLTAGKPYIPPEVGGQPVSTFFYVDSEFGIKTRLKAIFKK